MKKILISFLVALTLLVAITLPVFAIADPDTPPAVNAVYVYDLEDGGVGVLIDYYLDYAVNPTETATEAYMASFIDTDNVTILKSVAPYTYQNSGYGHGLIWMKFTASEVSTYGLTSANQALYHIWLTGNPTLAWAGDPPKTIAIIDQWNTTGDPQVLLALRVLYYADLLELEWSLDLIETTALGNRLTTLGESYFENVIQDLRELAPACYSSGTVTPTKEDIDYSTEYAAVATGSIVAGTPFYIAEGGDTLTATGIGNMTITLGNGVSGNITNGTGTIGSSPSNLVEGDNIVLVTGAGNFAVDVNLINTQTTITDTVTGTGFDLTTIAAIFGMSRLMFSGLLWVLLGIIACAATYVKAKDGQQWGANTSGPSNAVMLVMAIWLLGGTLLGMLDMRVAGMLVIGYAAYIGYVIFFRTSADIGRTLMFLGWMWFVVCLVGGVMVGSVPQASTYLTTNITDSDTTITVNSTAGFRTPGFIVIGDERISFSETSATTFTGTALRPVVRGASDTDAAAHSVGDSVRTVENALLNDSLNYNIALLSDASGLMQFLAIPLVIWNIVTSFIFLPIAFLGTDMVILTYVWGIICLGFLVSVFIAVAGGRRV